MLASGNQASPSVSPLTSRQGSSQSTDPDDIYTGISNVDWQEMVKNYTHLLFKCRLCLFCVYSMSGGGRSVREGLAMRVQGPTLRSPGPMLKSQAW